MSKSSFSLSFSIAYYCTTLMKERDVYKLILEKIFDRSSINLKP